MNTIEIQNTMKAIAQHDVRLVPISKHNKEISKWFQWEIEVNSRYISLTIESPWLDQCDQVQHLSTLDKVLSQRPELHGIDFDGTFIALVFGACTTIWKFNNLPAEVASTMNNSAGFQTEKKQLQWHHNGNPSQNGEKYTTFFNSDSQPIQIPE